MPSEKEINNNKFVTKQIRLRRFISYLAVFELNFKMKLELHHQNQYWGLLMQKRSLAAPRDTIGLIYENICGPERSTETDFSLSPNLWSLKYI